jgi:cytidine deaminase
MIQSEQREALVQASRRAWERAYAPYSRFNVGAAILGADGKIYEGVNVENASYGLTVCAERTAVFTMVTQGITEIRAVAVCTEAGVAPCGACRQVLREFSAPDVPVFLCDNAGNVRALTLAALLPESFGSEDLPDMSP